MEFPSTEFKGVVNTINPYYKVVSKQNGISLNLKEIA
jgi:hypothetical protein